MSGVHSFMEVALPVVILIVEFAMRKSCQGLSLKDATTQGKIIHGCRGNSKCNGNWMCYLIHYFSIWLSE